MASSLFRSVEQALQDIIKLIPQSSEEISIFDILKAYDTYIEQSGISFEDPFAYEIYEIIIHASRRAQDHELRNLLTNYQEIQKLKIRPGRKSSGFSDASDNSAKYKKQLSKKGSYISKQSSKTQSISPEYRGLQSRSENPDWKEYNIQFKNYETSSEEEIEGDRKQQDISSNDKMNPENNQNSGISQTGRSRLGQYQQFQSNVINSGVKVANPFSDNLYRYATEQGEIPASKLHDKYSIRKYSYSPNNKMDSNNNLNRSTSPIQHQNNRNFSPFSDNSKILNQQGRVNSSNSNNNSFNSGTNNRQSQKVRFHTQNADEYVNVQSPITSINNHPQYLASLQKQSQLQNSANKSKHIHNKSLDNISQYQTSTNDNKRYLSLEPRDYQQYQFMPKSHKEYLSVDSKSHEMLKQKRESNEQQLTDTIEEYNLEKRHRSVEEIEDEIDEVRNEMAKGLRRKWVLHYHFSNWKDYIQRWKGATEYINKEEEVDNFIQLKIYRKYFEKWEQYVQEENTWKEAKLNFVLQRRENILRKCFNELRDRLNDGKVDKYTYFAAKYKKEQHLKEKYFQKFIQFSRNHRSNRLKLERTQNTANVHLKRAAFYHLKQLKEEKAKEMVIKNDLKMKQSILEKKISFDRFVNNIRSILCFKKKKDILNKAIEIQLKQHSLLSMIDNFRIIKYFKIQGQRADELYSKNLHQKFFYHMKLFLFNSREQCENTDAYNQVRVKSKHYRFWQQYMRSIKAKEQKYKDGRMVYLLYRMMTLILNESDYQISQQRNIQFEAFKEQVMFLQKNNQQLFNQPQNQQSFGKGENYDEEDYDHEQIDHTHQSLMQNSNSNNNLLSNNKKIPHTQKSRNGYLHSRSTQATALQNNINPNQVFDTVRSFSPALPRTQNEKISRAENHNQQDNHFLSDQDESDNQRYQRNSSEQNFVYQTQRQSHQNVMKIYENQEVANEQQIDEEIALQIIGHGIFFTFPSIFSINYYNKTQTEKLFQSHQTLNKFILQKTLKSWVSFLQKRKDFRKKILNKTYSTHFQAIKTFSVKSQCLRFCVEKMQTKLNKKLIENIILLIIFLQLLQRMYSKLSPRKFMNGVILEAVRRFSLKRQKEKYQTNTLRSIVDNIPPPEIKAVILDKQDEKDKYDINRIFYTWRAYADKRRQRNYIYQQVQKIQQQKIYKECLYALADYRDKHSRSSRNRNVVKAFLFNKYIIQSFKKLLQFSKSHRMKKLITAKVRIAHQQKLMQDSLHKLKDYKNVRQKKVTLQAKNTEKVEKVFAKKHFRAWYQLGCRNQSFRYLVDLVKRLQLSRFFVIMKYQRQRDFQKQKMIKSDHLIFLKLTIFNAFVKYHRKKKYERKSSEYIKCRQQLNYAKTSMNQWKRLHQVNKNITYLCAKSILTIKNDILQKYFGILKEKWVLKSQERQVVQDREFALKKKLLLGFRKYTTYKMVNYENMVTINERRKRQIKQSVVNIWLRKLFNKQHQDEVERAITKYRKHKVLQVWADLYNVKNNLQKIIKVSDFSGFKRIEQSQEIALQTTCRGQKKNLRQFFFNMLKLNQKIQYQRVFRGIKNIIEVKKTEKQKAEQINEVIGQRITSQALSVWIKSSQHRIRKYNMIKKLKETFQNYQKRIGFESIQGQEQIYLQLLQKSKKAAAYRQKYLKKKIFAKLKANAIKERKIQRRSKELQEMLQRNALASFYNKLRNFTYQSIDNKKKNELISTHQYLYQLNKIFGKWKSYIEKRKERYFNTLKLQKFLNRKRIRRVFSTIKSKCLENTDEKKNSLKSERLYRTNLLLKSYATLKKYNNLKKLKEIHCARAEESYNLRLLNRVFTTLKYFIINKNIVDENHRQIIQEYEEKKAIKIKQGIIMVWKYYTEMSKDQLEQYRLTVDSSVLRSKFVEWKIKTHLLRDKRMKFNIISNTHQFRLKASLFKKWQQRSKLHSVLTNIFVYHARMEIKKRLVKWNQQRNQIRKNIIKSNQQPISKPKSEQDVSKLREVFSLMKGMAQNTLQNKNEAILQQKKQDNKMMLSQVNIQQKTSQLIQRLNQMRYFSAAQHFIYNLKVLYIEKKQEEAHAKKTEKLNNQPQQKYKLKNSMIEQTLKEQKEREQLQKLNRFIVTKQKEQVKNTFSYIKSFFEEKQSIIQQAQQHYENQLQFKAFTSWKQILQSAQHFSVILAAVLNKALTRNRSFFLRDGFRQLQVRFIKIQAAKTFAVNIDKSLKRQYAKKFFLLFEEYKSKTQVLKHMLENYQIKMNTQRAVQFFNILKNLKIQSERSNRKCKEYLFTRRIKQMKTVLAILQIYTQYRRNKGVKSQKAFIYRETKMKQKYLFLWGRAYFQLREYQQQMYISQQQQIEQEIMKQIVLSQQGQLTEDGQPSQLTKEQQEEQLQILQQQYRLLQEQQQLLQQQQIYQQNQRYQHIQSDQLHSDENEFYNEEPITYSDVPGYQNQVPHFNQNMDFNQQNMGSITNAQLQQIQQFAHSEQDMEDLLFDKPRQYIPQQQKQQQPSTYESQKQSNFLSQQHNIINEQSEEHESDSQIQKYLRESHSYSQEQQHDSSYPQKSQQDQQDESYNKEQSNQSYQYQQQRQSYQDQHNLKEQQGEVSYELQEENEEFNPNESHEQKSEDQQYTFSQDDKKSSSNVSKNRQEMSQLDENQQSLKSRSNKSNQNMNNQYQQNMHQQQLELIQNQYQSNLGNLQNNSYEQQNQSGTNKSTVEEYKEEDFLDQNDSDNFMNQSEEDSQGQANFILQQHLEQKQESIMQMTFNILRKYAIDKKINRFKEEEAMQTAYEVYESNLANRIFNFWKNVCSDRIKMSNQQKRSYLYHCFLSWKMYSKEKKLLKKYLSEAEMDEQLAYTPQTTERLNLLFQNNDLRSSQQKFQRSGSYNNLEGSNKTSSDSQKGSSMASALFTGKLKIQDTLNLDKSAPH